MAAAADDLTRLPRGGVGRPSSGVCELKLELIQTQMAQKPILRGEACVGRFYRAEFLEGRRFKKVVQNGRLCEGRALSPLSAITFVINCDMKITQFQIYWFVSWWPAGGAESLSMALRPRDSTETDAAPRRCQQPRGVPTVPTYSGIAPE